MLVTKKSIKHARKTVVSGVLSTALALALAVPVASQEAQATPDAPSALLSGITPEKLFNSKPFGANPQPFPELTATGAILYDGDNQVLLGGVDPVTPRSMASTTKIMTVLLALEALERGQVSEDVVVSQNAIAASHSDKDSSLLGLKVGQQLKFRDLLAATLMRSGNDGAIAIAEHVAGGEVQFVELMNNRAKELGLASTHFINASGLTDDAAHYASPLDLVLLGEEAMQHPDFARWARAISLEIPGFGKVENTNELLKRYPGTTGIKTGFLTKAGLCLVASAERNGRTLYAVVLGSTDRVQDVSKLFDYGFNAYDSIQGTTSGTIVEDYRWASGSIPVIAYASTGATVVKDSKVLQTRFINPAIALPIKAGAEIGNLTISIDGQIIGETPLIAGADLDKPAQDSVGLAFADLFYAFSRSSQMAEVTQISGAKANPNEAPGYDVGTEVTE